MNHKINWYRIQIISADKLVMALLNLLKIYLIYCEIKFKVLYRVNSVKLNTFSADLTGVHTIRML